jgi:stage V sporulation protein G
MEITSVQIRLTAETSERVKAYATLVIDECFVIRDVKVIRGNSGLLVAMPSRRLTVNCRRCRTKNQLRAHYCNDCGARLDKPEQRAGRGGRQRFFEDMAHPTTPECRDYFERTVIAAYQQELDRRDSEQAAEIPDAPAEEEFPEES